MKKAIRIASGVYLAIAIVNMCIFIVSIFLNNLLANLFFDLVNQARGGDIDPEAARYYILVITIISAITGTVLSGGQLALAIINRNCALVDISKGKRIALIVIDYLFSLYVLAAFHLVYLIQHRHDPEEVKVID